MRFLTLLALLVLLVFVPSAPVAWATPDETAGARIFELQCAGCHINGGNIVRRGKNLRQKTLDRNGYGTVEAIAQLVTNGKGNMSAYKDRLTPEEIEQVSAYVLQRAAENWK